MVTCGPAVLRPSPPPLPPLAPALAPHVDVTSHWAVQLGQRVRVRLWLKIVGTTAFMWIFFIAYFHLLRNPAGLVQVLPLTWVDHAVPFQPGAFVAYVSLWFYVGIPPGLMVRVHDALIYAAWGTALCLTGLALFWLWPTAVPADWQRLAAAPGHAGMALLQGVDAAGNACPSMHVAGATFSAFWVRRALRQVGAPPWALAANWAWLAAIVYSTLALRQHVFWDVVGGVALALPFAAVSLRAWRSGPR